MWLVASDFYLQQGHRLISKNTITCIILAVAQNLLEDFKGLTQRHFGVDFKAFPIDPFLVLPNPVADILHQ